MEKYFIQGNLSNKKLNAKNAVTLGYTINLNRKTTGPTNNEKKLAEKSLLRRIYNGIRILRVSLLLTLSYNYINKFVYLHNMSYLGM